MCVRKMRHVKGEVDGVAVAQRGESIVVEIVPHANGRGPAQDVLVDLDACTATRNGGHHVPGIRIDAGIAVSANLIHGEKPRAARERWIDLNVPGNGAIDILTSRHRNGTIASK